MKRAIAAILTLVFLLTCAIAAPAAMAETSVSARTTLSGSSSSKRQNIALAADQINGITVPYGASFSFNDTVGPRTSAYGYVSARNGRGVSVTGGGVSQVATTLYLALLQVNGSVSFDDIKTYGSKFADNYVSDGDDAIITDYSANTDFAFTNYTDDMYIEMWTTDSYLYCSITLKSQSSGGSLNWNPGNSGQGLVSSASFIIGSDYDLRNNISLACDIINDTTLSGGSTFSFNDVVGPRTARYGYLSAINGRGVSVTGGGVAQVASVIWLAIRNLDCISIVQKSTYGGRYNQDYVSSSNDAILTDYSAGTDFSFRNTGSAALTINTYISGDLLCCDIYEN